MENVTVVPLGILLSEEVEKVAVSAAAATSVVWTGGPDSQVPDNDFWKATKMEVLVIKTTSPFYFYILQMVQAPLLDAVYLISPVDLLGKEPARHLVCL